MKKRILLMLICAALLPALAMATTVKGLVVDESDEPVAGATVKCDGTNKLTVTDIDGLFTLDVPDGVSTLTISSIGMKPQQVAVKPELRVVMEASATDLDEVIVVGYGKQQKVNLTGAVGVIDDKAFEAVPVSNAVQALQGQIAGLNIYSSQGGGLNAKQDFNVRGYGTIGEGSSGGALVLIDGMEGDLYTVNPQDIESISVLKDAAASSIYGSRAPFGVILVTTKKGKAGKVEVNYNNSFRFSSPINMPKSLDSYTWALFYNEACYNSGWGPYNWVSEERLGRIKDYMDGKITATTVPVPGNPDFWGDGYSHGNDNIDYYDFFFKDNVFSQEHNISVSGGNDKVNYYVSGNFLGQDGELRVGKEDNKRYTVTAKLSAELSKYVTMSTNTRFVRTDYVAPSKMSEGFFGDIGRQCWPTKPLYDPNGILYDDHVLGMKDGGSNKERNTWIYQSLNLVVTPLEGWNITADLNYRYNSEYYHWDYLTYSQTRVDGVTPANKWNDNTTVGESTYASDYFNLNFFTDYTRTFARDHNTKFLFGFQNEQNNYRNFDASKVGIIYPGKPTINTSTGLDNTGTKVPPTVHGGHNRWATQGFFGRINYDFKGKYLAEVNMRYDGSSRFRKGSRWVFSPSASLGWNIARENFLNPYNDIVNTLKIRASYGQLGNQNTNSLYPTYSTMGTGTGSWLLNGQLSNIAWAPALVSYNLTWEKIRTFNVGLDWGLFNNKLTGSFDYFIRDTKDMVGPSEKLPQILGTGVPSANNTDLRTSGWELEIMWKQHFANGLSYSARFTLADSRTKITRYSNPSGLIDGYYNGKYMGELWGYQTIGIAKSDEEMANHLATLPNGGQSNLGQDWRAGDIMYADLNGDGKIDQGSRTLDNHGDLKRMGNSTPRYNFGIDLAANWKGFDIRMFWQGTMKRDFWQGSYYFWGANGRQGPWFSTAIKGHEDYFRADADNPLGQNLDSYYPRPLFSTDKNQQSQSRYLQDASYIRLKNLQIGYSLPKQLLSKIGVRNLRIFASGENLLTFTKLCDFFDPEAIGGGNWGHGFTYPLSRTYSFGLNVTF